MKKKLEMLEQLQEIDIQIDLLKNSQSGLHKELELVVQDVTVAREELAEREASVQELELAKQELESSLDLEQENIRRSETNMKEIKTNKEFQAVGREITAARKQTSDLEEQILQKLALIEELKSDIAARAADFSTLEKNTDLRRKEKEKQIKELQQSIDNDLAKREAITGELAPALLKRYDNLRAQRRGQAVAVARDGYCLGCNMQLPPQLYNSLFRSDELIACPHCQRVLILKLQQQG